MGLRKYALIGVAALGIAAAANQGLFNEPKEIPQETRIEYNIQKIELDLLKNPNGPYTKNWIDDNYDIMVQVVEKYLYEHPEYANPLIRAGMESLNQSGSEIEEQSFTLMYGEMSKKVEENPEILDFLGENAQDYMREKHQNKYVVRVENFFDDLNDAKDRGFRFLKTIGDVVNFLWKQ